MYKKGPPNEVNVGGRDRRWVQIKKFCESVWRACVRACLRLWLRVYGVCACVRAAVLVVVVVHVECLRSHHTSTPTPTQESK